jgi:hypothetical protein
MTYKVTDAIEEATHWVPTEDENNEFSAVTIGTAYPLIWDGEEKEYFILNKEGEPSLIFLAHSGDFIIKGE